MGPFVPDIITDELNLIVGFFIGVAFGFVLEQAGFSSSRILTGLFYGRDFTVLRVFFTAAVTAMSGVILLSHVGLLDVSLIYINPTYLYSAIVGGAIMGVGFVVGGYCPGTSFCGAAIGKIDAMVFSLGGFLGVLLFGEAFPLVRDFYKSGSLGDLRVYSALGMSQGAFALLLIVVAIAAFVVTTRIELKVSPYTPAKSFPMRHHRWAAIGVLTLGLLLAVMPDRKARLWAKASDEIARHKYPVNMMTTDELTFRILDHDPSLQMVDVRDAAAFAKMTLPGAVNIPTDAMFGREWRDVLGQPGKKVFFADNEEQGVRAATLARLLGYENVVALKGGLGEFTKTILRVHLPERELTRGERDTYRFRLKAAPQIAALIKEQGAPKPVKKRIKKIVGGCGA